MADAQKIDTPKKMAVSGLAATVKKPPVLSLGVRIKLAVDSAPDLDMPAIAREIGVSRTAIYNWIKEEWSNEPDLTTLEKLASVTGVSFPWLATGLGEMRPNRKEQVGRPPDGFIRVRLIKHRNTEWTFRDAGPLAFEQGWLIKLTGGHSPVAGIEAPDDTMEPTIKKGVLLLFNNFEPVSHGGAGDVGNGIYVVGLAKFEYAIRRVQWRPGIGKKVISSDNKVYPPETYPIESAEFPSICGPVIWRAGRLT